MSRMAATTRRRSRRQFSDEFRAGAVRLVLEEGKTVGAVARELDLTESALRQWVERARADRSGGRTGLTTAEREELARLRKENRILAEERDILKKRRPASRSRAGKISVHCRGEGQAHRHHSVPVSRGHTQRVLRVATTLGSGTITRRPAVEGPRPSVR